MSDDQGDYADQFFREPGADVLDLGNDVRLLFHGRQGHPDGVRVGAWLSHPTPDRGRCIGAVQFDVPAAEGLKGPRWTVEQWEPLTLSPSVLCSCGWHGWVRDGRWVQA